MALMKTSIFALLGLAALSVGLVLNFVMPRIRYYAWIILFYFSRVQHPLISHQLKFGVGTTVGISLFFGVILLANAISVGNFHRFDFTGLAQYTQESIMEKIMLFILWLVAFISKKPNLIRGI